jgi:hypothetical protein
MNLRAIAIAIAVVVVLGASTACCFAADDRRDMRAFLARSAESWNRGDLDGFMRGYENSPDTVYVSAKGIIRGYAAIRAHYAAHYGKSGMGVLSFSDLAVRPLGENYAVVLAHWHLGMSGGKRLSGVFSLVLHRSSAGWHIIEDCTP